MPCKMKSRVIDQLHKLLSTMLLYSVFHFTKASTILSRSQEIGTSSQGKKARMENSPLVRFTHSKTLVCSFLGVPSVQFDQMPNWEAVMQFLCYQSLPILLPLTENADQ